MRQDQKAQVKDYDAKLSEHSLAKRKILLFITATLFERIDRDVKQGHNNDKCQHSSQRQQLAFQPSPAQVLEEIPFIKKDKQREGRRCLFGAKSQYANQDTTSKAQGPPHAYL